ncbi:MAG TPA: hypothetical protein VF898_11360 [Chloroflexota bacterium]
MSRASVRFPEMARHIEQLCREHSIQMVEYNGRRSFALPARRAIYIRPIKTQRTYIIALHEIGHIVGRGRSGRRLEGEAAAWEYVLQTTMAPLSAASYRFMLRALESYVARAKRRKGMVLPAQESRFWQTHARLKCGAACPG